MKKLILFVLIISMAFSCVFAFTACNEEEPLSKWDVRQFYGTYDNVEKSIAFSMGGSTYSTANYTNTKYLEIGKVITTESEFQYDFITQEMADWVNVYLNNFISKIVIDEEKICIGNLEYAYEKTFLYDYDEEGNLRDEHYLLTATNDDGHFTFNVGYGPTGMQAVNFRYEAYKEFNDIMFKINIYGFLYKTH